MKINGFNKLQWKIIDLFESVPKSITSDEFSKLPSYDFKIDKNVVMNQEFFVEGSKYTYCKLDTYKKD